MEGRVIRKPGVGRGLIGVDALPDKLCGIKEPFLAHICVYGTAGTLFEKPHEMIFAQINLFREYINGQSFGEMFVYI